MKWRVPTPDGKTIEFDAPDGTSQDQALAYAKANYKAPEPTYGGEFLKGAGRKLVGMAGDVADVFTGKNLREHISDLGAAATGAPSTFTPSAGERMTKATGLEADPNANMGQNVAGAIGETLVDPLSWVGPGGPLLKTAGAVFGGAGSEVAGEAAHEVAPSLELPARILGGAAGGRAAGAGQALKRGQRGAAALKTGDELHDSSQAAYKVIENAPVQVNPAGMQNLRQTIDQALDKAHYHPITADQTYRFLDQWLGDEHTTNPQKLAHVMDLHEKLGNVTPQINAKDAAASQVARGAIRDWLDQHIPQANAPLRQALGDWSSYKKVQEVQKGLTTAEHRAEVSGTGANTQNAVRQEIRKILDSDKRLRGFRPEERAQMEKIVAGTLTQNALRTVGKMAPNHLTLLTAVLNAPLALAGKAVASGARKIGDVMTRQQVERLMSMIQERAPSNATQAAANQSSRLNSARNTDAATIRGAAVPATNYLDNPGQQGLE